MECMHMYIQLHIEGGDAYPHYVLVVAERLEQPFDCLNHLHLRHEHVAVLCEAKQIACI